MSGTLEEREGFSAWFGSFFDSYYRFRPVNASFIGVHEWDSKLPDFTTEGVGRLKANLEGLLEKSENVRTDNWVDSTDLTLAINFILIQLEELRTGYFHMKNPSLYTSEAVFGLISLCLRDYGPREQRLVSMARRMGQIPFLLETGENNVRKAPKEWTNEAIKHCEGAKKFLDDGLKILLFEWGISSASFLKEQAKLASKAFSEYEDYLRSELLSREDDDYAAGREFFDLLMKKGHCLEDTDTEKVASYGRDRFYELKDLLSKETRKLRADGDWGAVVDELANRHPNSAAELLASCAGCWKDSVRFAAQKGLLDWPDYPIEYKFIPNYLKQAAPHLYFLYYRSPSPYEGMEMNAYLLTPVVDGEELKGSYFSYSTIKHNHVVHHGSLGHHLQNYHAYHSASRIGKVAAVDCASRIAMFCGGTMAEGWATYSTSLADEFGFNTQGEHIAEIHSQLRMAARAVVDSNLSMRRYSFSDAVDFYTKEAGMSPRQATSEVVKNSMFPGTGAMYLLGLDAIYRLRRSIASRRGEDFNLKRFHNSLLSYGSIPLALIAKKEMSNEG